FDARLADDRPRLDTLEIGAPELRLRDFTHVPEEMGGHLAGILSRRHFLIDDAGELPAPRPRGDDLLAGRVLDEDDRPVARVAPAPVHGVAQLRDIDTRRGGERAQRL